jgi:peptidoglycan/LPS O-acetylase OafA/YrhL
VTLLDTRLEDPSPPSTQRLGHRPAVDGLRAVAVIAVLLYHGDVPGFRGGFLGVDVFFVISGFLITTLLVEERQRSGAIALGRFWVRRLRRLLPALLAVLAVVACYGWFVARPEQRSLLRGDVIATLSYVANWRFVATGQSYFQTFLEPSPLRHAWSLAVEEQWYVVWPVVVAVAMRATHGRVRALLPFTVLAALASAVLMAVLFDAEEPSRVYYGTDTRAQGVLVGSALAFWYHDHRRTRPRHGSHLVGRIDAFAWASLGVLVVAVMTLGDRSPSLYLGGFLAVSVVSAVMVHAAADDRVTTFQRAMSAPLLQWVGARSYGLYLWHWPVFVWLSEGRTGLDGPALFGLRLAVSFACTELSHRLVEQPVRNGALPGRRFAHVAILGSIAVVVLVVPLRSADGDGRFAVDSITATEFAPISPVPTSTPPASVTSVAGPASTPQDPDGDVADTGGTGAVAPAEPVSTTTTVPPPPPPLRVLVLGDSTAMTFVLGFPEALASQQVQQTGQASVGCGLAAGRPHSDDGWIPQPARCDGWREEWTSAVARVEPDVSVVMVGAWEILDHVVDRKVLRFGTQEWTDLVTATLDDAVSIAGAGGAPVALMGVPCMNESPDAAFPTQARNDPERVAAMNRIAADVAARHPGTTVIDLGGLLCPGGVYEHERDGVVLRSDGVHLGAEGARVTWEWLVPQLRLLQAAAPAPAAAPQEPAAPAPAQQPTG